MILSMAGCKGVLPGDGPPLGTPGGLQLLQSAEPVLLDVNRNMSQILALPPSPLPCSQEDVEVDLREVYFLVMHFLANGPCTRAFGQLWNELLQHKLLPRRYHGRYSRDGQPSGDENDDGLSFPLSYRDVANRNPDIPNSHLVDLLRQLLVNSGRSASGLDSLSKVVSAADTPTLLGSGTFSLLDSVRNRVQGGPSRWNLHMRWPHWHADQVSGLMLRELGGGFARHHRSPSVRTASYVVAKPSVFFSRIKPIKKLLGHRNAVYCAIFDRNGQHVITGSDDRLVKIWSTETGFCLRSCRGHEGDITDLAVSSNNLLVASASNDFSIRVWKLPNGFPVSVLRGHGGAVTAIKFSPRQGCDHHLLSSSDDGTCRIWDARDSAVNSRIYMPDPKDSQSAARGAAAQAPPVPPAGNQILCCAFNADGSVFVTGSSDKLARVWNATKWNDEHTGRPNYELDTLQGHENDVNYVQFSGCAAPTRSPLSESVKEEYQTRFKNTWLAHDSIVTCSRDGSAIIWTPKPRRHHAKAGRWVKAYHLKVPPPPMPPQPPRPGGTRQRLLPTPRGVNMVVWSLDNRFVLAAIMDCRICVWNAADGSLVHSLTGHDKQTYVLDVHPFNPRIAMSAGYDGRVIIWDIWDGHPVRVYETGDYNLVDGNFSPDGSSLVVSDEVGQIYLFATGEGNSQKDAKYDQFFLGDFRPLVRDTHGNVLDQESQLPPHQRNIQDLLCDINMIPYAEPYQSLYQQRRLGALGIDWQPPAVQFQIGTLDDPPYAGPPEPPPPLPPPVVVRSPPEVRERRALASEGGNRWVEQPNEVEETVDWDQEAAGMTEDSGSDYSASEDGEDDVDEKGDSMDEGESEEEDEEDEDDEVRGDITIRLRRSSRNKRKAQPLTVTYSSSGRRLKRKRYDDGGDIQERRSLRRRKGKRIRRHSPPRRPSPTRRAGAASSSRQSNRNQPEPSTRPKRQAARNALHLLSSINDEEDEEQPVAQAEAEEDVSDEVERASGSGERQRVLRSRNGGEQEEAPSAPLTQGNKIDNSDRGEFSRRPRSQRKLVVKLRSTVPKAEPEDSKIELMDDPQVDAAAAPDDAEISPGGAILEDQAGPSDNPAGQRPVPKLVIKHPKPSGGHKRHAAVIESSEENHGEDGTENDFRHRRLGCQFDSDDDEGLDSAEKPVKEQDRWQWKKGKAAKRARGDHPEDHIHGSGSSNSGSAKDEQRDWGDENGASGSLQRSPTHVLADPGLSNWENGRLLATDAASLEEAGEGEASAPPSASQYIGGGEPPSEPNDIPCRSEAPGLEIGGSSEQQQRLDIRGPNREGLYSPRSGLRLDNLTDAEKPKQESALEGDNGFIDTGHQVPPEHEADGVAMNREGLGGTSAGAAADGVDNDAVLLKERTSDGDLGPGGLHSLYGDSRSRSGFDSEMDNLPAEDGVGPWEASRRITSAHYSDNEGKDSPVFGGKESSPPGRAFPDLANSDHQMDMMEGEADNDPGSEGHRNGSIQKSDSDGNNSESELFESNGNSGRNWDELGDNRETDEESADGRQRMRHTRQRALGDLHHIVNKESNNRHEAGLDTPGKTRIRNLNSVLNEPVRETRSKAGKSRSISLEPTTGLPERSTRRRTKDAHPPWQNGAGPIGWGSRTRQAIHNEGPGPGPGSGPARYASLDSRKAGRARAAEESTSDQEELFNVDYDAKRVVRLDNLREDTRGGGRQPAARERRTSGRTRPHDGRREQIAEGNRRRTAGEGNTKDGRDRRSWGKPEDRKKTDLSWLLLTEVEAGTRYIPQYADDVVYVRQGHEEYLGKDYSLGTAPWNNRKYDIRAVEFCRITGLEYSILKGTGHTCCELTLRFTDQSSRMFGKSFKLRLPELNDDADFIVEKSRYEAGLKKGWRVRDKCRVWWRSDDEADGGKWWDGRITGSNPKSPDFPDSPWEQFTVLYSMESNTPERHSPWELFEPENHYHDPPHIDDESKEQLLSAITTLEQSCYVGKEDEFGLRRLMQDVENVEYRNKIPLPLDLEVVKQRLKKDYYHSLEAFRHDVQLLVKNTDTFHGEDSEMAGTVQKLCSYLVNVVTYDEEPVSSDGNAYGSEEDGSDGDSSEDISSDDEDDA